MLPKCSKVKVFLHILSFMVMNIRSTYNYYVENVNIFFASLKCSFKRFKKYYLSSFNFYLLFKFYRIPHKIYLETLKFFCIGCNCIVVLHEILENKLGTPSIWYISEVMYKYPLLVPLYFLYQYPLTIS